MEEEEEEEEQRYQKKSRSNSSVRAVAAGAVESLTDDLIVEIVSRLPLRSVHRCKCVSRSWRDLIAHPDHRKKLPQDFAGFFYTKIHGDRLLLTTPHFADVSAAGRPPPPVDTSLSFLPPKFIGVDRLDACAGLLLCRCYCSKDLLHPAGESHVYLVCNPATGRWVELPPHPEDKPDVPPYIHTFRLAFDPKVSSQFHVFAFEDIYITGVTIYSSKTGAWNHMDSGWNHITRRLGKNHRDSWQNHSIRGLEKRSVFANGMLHLITGQSVMVAVDMERMSWMTIPLPGIWHYGIGLSQGRLIFVNRTLGPCSKILFWCLADYDSKEWVLKHSVTTEAFERIGEWYTVIAVDPDRDAIFLASWNDTALVLLDMEHEELRHILNLERGSSRGPYLPYAPLFSESLANADGH